MIYEQSEIWDSYCRDDYDYRQDLEPEEEECPICGSPLTDSGNCEDVGNNNCQYLKGIE